MDSHEREGGGGGESRGEWRVVVGMNDVIRKRGWRKKLKRMRNEDGDGPWKRIQGREGWRK